VSGPCEYSFTALTATALNAMAHPLKTTVPVAGAVGGLIGLAFAPWWAWAPTGAASGCAYAVALTLIGIRLGKWLRGGSPERHAGVMVGGTMGAIIAALVGAVAVVTQFTQPAVGESAELFALGALGVAAGGPVGFVVGGLAGGLLTALYEWVDSRYVAPLRAKSEVVERATTIGAAIGVLVGVSLVLVFGLRRRGAPRPEAPSWLGPTLLVLLLLGLFWAVRLVAKRNREAAMTETVRLAHPRWQAAAVGHAVGFAGGAIGFLVGAVLHAAGWRTTPAVQPVAKEKRKARPGWWKKRRA
jgi:hypothetical protein